MPKKSYKSDLPCVACGENFLDRCFHHITSRGAGGDESESNRISLCFKCHTLWHKAGTSHMIKKYYSVYKWLKKHGRDDILDKALR